MKLSNINRRSAFTLLELLVVIAIIGILAALTAGGIMRLKQSQTDARTTETLQKLDRAYASQMQAAIDMFRKETVPEATMMWANGNKDLAQIIHIKLRLRQEFPQSSDDLHDHRNPIDPRNQPSPPPITGIANLDNQLRSIYAPKTYYMNYKVLVYANNLDNNANSALFMLAMSQSRGGQMFNPEQIGAGSLGKVNVTSNVPNPPGAPVSTTAEFKVFMDGFGTPIIYARQIPGDLTLPVLAELNAPPYVSPSAVAGKRDPLDPTGVLTNWSGRTALNNWLKVNSDGLNRGPTIVSAGADKQFGTGDDLHSFRLKGTGKAN